MNGSNLESDTSKLIPLWLEEARHGGREALGRLWESCRAYLLLVANAEIGPELRAKVHGSDAVQETFLKAQQNIDQFTGTSEEELLAWLRKILVNHLIQLKRQYQVSAKRAVSREQSLQAGDSRSFERNLAGSGDSPSSLARKKESDEALERGLEQLPMEYQEVIRLRNWERSSFDEIGKRMGRSAEASRKLWGRAIEKLKTFLEPPHGS